MLPEEKELLEKSVALGEENNKMLRSLTRSMRWGRIMRIVYWTLLIGSALGAYYFIQPYIEQVLGVYSGARGNIEDLNSFIENLKQ
jgi:hypothetical protein